MALEKFSRPGEILLGGTFMRQNNFIFDVEKNNVGVSRARCNVDPFMIIDEQEMITVGGQRYGLDPTYAPSQNQVCSHGRSVNGNQQQPALEEEQQTIGVQKTNADSGVSTNERIAFLAIFLIVVIVICIIYAKFRKLKANAQNVKPKQPRQAKGLPVSGTPLP